VPLHPAIEFWLKVFTVLAALVAMVVTWRTHADRTTFEMIDRLYTLCHALEAHALRDWYLAHLYCIGAGEYEVVKARIRHPAAAEPARWPEFLVKEKLFAIHVFIVYEQIYYQRLHTTRSLNPRRYKFLGDMLSYFTDRLVLQNPRLIAFLQADPTGAGLHLEECSRKFLAEAIAAASGGHTPQDPEGPFAP